jgi:hypothetical protein
MTAWVKFIVASCFVYRAASLNTNAAHGGQVPTAGHRWLMLHNYTLQTESPNVAGGGLG